MNTVLIVDDHPAICFALKVLLEAEQHYKAMTSSGERLLQQIRELNPDLVVLDIELNGGDGLAALPRIKQINPGIHILMLTAQPAPLYAQRAFDAGADGFISKQMPLPAVVSLCQLILSGYQCFPSHVTQALRLRKHDDETPSSLLARFSARELSVLRQLRAGKSNKEIADVMMLSNKTISTYKARMLEKSGLSDIEALYLRLDEEGKAP